MNRAKIGIIGAGNLGIRHLQALALLKEACQITVMDINREALRKAEIVFKGTQGAWKHEACFVSGIRFMPAAMDIVIIATSADVRRNVIEELLEQAHVFYLVLEKVLFQHLDDYEAVASLLERKQVKAFVNCPRRMHPICASLKQKLADAQEMEIMYCASDWSLGCNAIHILDFIAYLAGSQDIEIDISALDPQYQQSKRSGFLEITGTIRGSMGRCRAFSLSSYRKQGFPVSTVILSDTCRIHMMEWKKELEYADASTGWEWKKQSFEIPYQSHLTNLAVEELLSSGNCRLTSFEESSRLHIALERKLIPYFERQGVEPGLCPIT